MSKDVVKGFKGKRLSTDWDEAEGDEIRRDVGRKPLRQKASPPQSPLPVHCAPIAVKIDELS